MAGGLTIEVDEEVPLVENAATASLFSPGMWVQRPQRTPAAVQDSAHDADLADQRGTTAAALRAGGLDSPLADPDLAYLHISDERESVEKEYLKQDSEHMEALEEAYARLVEQNRAMEQQLNGVVAAVNDVMDENRTVKQLLAMLQVRREDFVFNPQQTIAAQQEAIGLRLLRNLEGSPSVAALQPLEQQQEQQQQDATARPGAQQQQQQQHMQQGQGTQLQHQVQQFGDPFLTGPAAMSVGPSPLDLTSPGGLLPLSTPSMLRTASPKIGAFRLNSQQAGDPATAPPPPAATVIPASPYDFPAESQIAAAALTAKQGDTAAALLTLLDKAIEGRLERQQQAQQTVQPGQHVSAAHKGEQPPQQRVYGD